MGYDHIVIISCLLLLTALLFSFFRHLFVMFIILNLFCLFYCICLFFFGHNLIEVIYWCILNIFSVYYDVSVYKVIDFMLKQWKVEIYIILKLCSEVRYFVIEMRKRYKK